MTLPGRSIRIPLVFLVALLLHTTVLPSIGRTGLQPDVMMLLGIAGGIVGGRERGAVCGFMAGMLGGLFVEAPLGLHALVFSIVGFAVGALQATIIRAAFWIPIATATIASAGGFVLYAVAAAVVGQGYLIEPRLALVAGVGALLNGVLSVVVVPAVAWAFPDTDARQAFAR